MIRLQLAAIVVFLSLNALAFRLENPERREIPLTPKIIQSDSFGGDDETSQEIIEYSEFLQNRTLEFRLRCKTFGLSFSFGGIVQSQSSELNDGVWTLTIKSFVQCLKRDED